MGVVVSVTKRFKFSAAHRLPDDPGPCHRVHGHTYTVEVTATGEVDEQGMVIHFDALKNAWATVEPLLDHRDLNESLARYVTPPTTEHVALWLLAELHDADERVTKVVLWEGPNACATVERV